MADHAAPAHHRTVASVDGALARAVELATRGPAWGPNPRVGCVILAPVQDTADDGAVGPRVVLAEGWHRGAGTPHAEAAALAAAREAGVDVRGATAVVTLEPCNHTGRTGPCAVALEQAGVAEVVYAVADPNPVAAGGADHLAAHGVRTELRPTPAATELVRTWATSAAASRPYVIVKTAATLDGRVAAADGTSRWITGPEARAHAHEVRAAVDAVAVGTGTVAADDPALTARRPDGTLAEHQPLRVVVGRRDVPDGARLRTEAGGELLQLATHDVAEVLAVLAAREVRTLLVEGGPRLATAFLEAGVVDELHAYVAPVLLGAGPGVVGGLGITTIADALRWRTHDVRRLGDDVLLTARSHPSRPRPTSQEA
ncbi:bifunctional diaminohydroxyphosphoribosylaminopyrimidine deaminase/5-amino-6-(5-phosphoribosylamino)uracil reductase RibD [Luteimicrobium sp. DT211]|uniref:bifunctional diaminohydroxyphosphoribosylaminopyrimidine deaminase/5-amino-6-(5-phosphoribosylamino)uracil reductase RibD n=1 Tax=Luteimicrobium sp. DT211 TaxID=3393412 RepID=UPI003CE6BC09